MTRRKSASPLQGVRGVNFSTSPLLASKTPRWRSRMVVLLVGIGFLVLVGRALYVQVLESEFFQKKGEERTTSTLALSASRGRIVDRNGQILAVSVSAPTVAASPKEFVGNNDQRRQLATLLQLDQRELDARLATPDSSYVVLKRQVDDGAVQQIRKLGVKGLHYEPGFQRRYPENEASAHIVGFTDIFDRGQEGVELAFQDQLQGYGGSRSVVRDRLGRVVEELGEGIDPRDGRDVELTIDSKLQAITYQRIRDAVEQHKAAAGSVVVLDARSGEILALANVPSYSPGERRNLSGAQLRNRAITDVFEPGSTVKPFVIARAIERDLVKPATVLDTRGFYVGPLLVQDTHPHPSMTVAQVVQKSSNVGTVRMAMQLEDREMWEVYTSLGFGQKPQIGFPGAATGRLRPYKSWRPVEKATMAYGYGLSVSLLQIARAYTALARDGEVAPLTLVRGGAQLPGTRVYTPETAQTMREMLRGTVSPQGTAPLAQPVGYSAGGKTGTAEKQEGRGYNKDKHRAWFVGIAPIEQPRVVVGVMVDEPGTGVYYGGLVAAPVFKQVVEQVLRTLGVPPDLETSPPPTPQQMAALKAAAASEAVR